RNRADGAQVGADVLAAGTVAAGGAAHEAAVLVAQADREAVELGLHRESGIGVAGLLLDPGDELAHLVLGEGIAERQHRHLVLHRRELARGRRADPDRGRIRIVQFRVRGFQFGQLAQHPVVLDVRQGRIVEHVIPVIRLLQHPPEFFHPRFSFRRFHRGFFSTRINTDQKRINTDNEYNQSTAKAQGTTPAPPLSAFQSALIRVELLLHYQRVREGAGVSFWRSQARRSSRMCWMRWRPRALRDSSSSTPPSSSVMRSAVGSMVFQASSAGTGAGRVRKNAIAGVSSDWIVAMSKLPGFMMLATLNTGPS